MITALLLAAGAARRFGGPKLLQDLHGKPLVRWSAEALQVAAVDEIIVVVPPAYDALRDALQGIDAYFIVNPHPALGLASSLACGVAALSADTEAVVVALGDEPTIARDAVRGVVERYRAGRDGAGGGVGARIVVPTYSGAHGHPVLFDRSVFAELRTFSGDAGARAVIDRDRSRVAQVEMGQPAPMDVDTPDDLARLRSQTQFTSPPTSGLP